MLNQVVRDMNNQLVEAKKQVAAFRKHVQEQYLASDLAKDWPEGMVDKINAM